MDADSSTSSISRSMKRKGRDEYETRTWCLNLKELSEEDFVKEFRIKKDTFQFICQSLEGNYKITKPKYPLDERVAFSLWRLATGAKDKEVSEKFGITVHTFRTCSLEVYQAIEATFKDDYLKWPEIEDRARIKKEFQEICGIQNMVGGLYTTHLEIDRPGNDKACCDPFNHLEVKRAGYILYTLPVQGLVDANGKFIDVYCDSEIGGKNSDEDFLWLSKISEKMGSGEIIVGGGTYPLLDWMMVPYYPVSNHSDEEILLFNRKIIKVQRSVRKAFGELIGRWYFLKQDIKVDRTDIPVIVRVCAILHNICKVRKDELHVKFTRRVGDIVTPVLAGNPPPSALTARDRIAKSLVELWADKLFEN